MNPNDFGDHVTFHLAPPAGQISQLSCEISRNLTDGLERIGLGKEMERNWIRKRSEKNNWKKKKRQETERMDEKRESK